MKQALSRILFIMGSLCFLDSNFVAQHTHDHSFYSDSGSENKSKNKGKNIKCIKVSH